MGLLVAIGCAGSSGTGGGGNGNTPDAGGGDDASADDSGGDDAAVDKLTWTFIYNTYIAKGATAGHCGNVGCHATARGGFLCGTQSNCYVSITNSNPSVGGKMVDPKNPSASVILDPVNSPVYWFSTSAGNMPEGALTPNAQAKADITAWINAGAPNN